MLMRWSADNTWRPQSVVPASEASTSPGNLVEMQVLRPYSRPTESETLRVRPSSLQFNKLSR